MDTPAVNAMQVLQRLVWPALPTLRAGDCSVGKGGVHRTSVILSVAATVPTAAPLVSTALRQAERGT